VVEAKRKIASTFGYTEDTEDTEDTEGEEGEEEGKRGKRGKRRFIRGTHRVHLYYCTT
jgi:hypothetical protein